MRNRPLFILLTVVAMLAGSVAPALAADQYTFKGYGYGHGIGLCQWGAKGRADKGQNYQQILTHYFQGTQVTTSANIPSAIRIRLFGSSNLAKAYFEGDNASALDFLSTDGTYAFQGAIGKHSVVANADSTLKILKPDGTVAADKLRAPLIVSNSTANITVYNSSGGRHHTYKGTIYIYPAASMTVYLVNNVSTEPDYINGLGEVPSSWPYDALYAQAVAARSYAIANMHPQSTFDLYDSTASQVYVGVDKVNEVSGGTNWGARWAKAVADTKGQVLTYGGQIISAYYFSSCGGHTENIELAWLNATAKPYLKGVSDLDSAGRPYCEHTGTSFNWTQTITQADIEKKLGITGFAGVEIIRKGASPRIAELKVLRADGTSKTMAGSDFRSKLGLKSTWIYQMGGSYPDVVLSHWAFAQIEDLTKRGVIGGYTNGTFRPENTVTRAEFTKMLCLALSIPSGSTSDFEDAKGNWAEGYISALVAKGIIKGYANGTFRPAAEITRAEICAIISRAKSLSTGSASAVFPDIEDHWAKPEIALVASNSIVGGYPNGVFRPNANATRAEVAAIIYRMLGI